MPEFAFQYWDRVKTELKENHTTLKDLADGIGVSYDVVRQWSSKNRYPKGDLPYKIAEWLHVSHDYLLTGTMTGKDSTEPAGGLCPEAQFVQEHPESRAIVRIMMKDLSLVPHLSAVFSAFAGDDLKEKKA